MHQILLGALDHDIVREGGGGVELGGVEPLTNYLCFGIKFKKLNLGLFRKNYSSYNRIYIFLKYLIPKRIFDIF